MTYSLGLCQVKEQWMQSLWCDSCRRNSWKILAFVDLEKVFDRVPREVVRWALRQLGVEEWLVQTVMTMYERARTVVRTKYGYSTEFDVKVGVHQGSVLSPLLFVAVMEVVTRGVKEGLPWELLYADDLVLVAQSKEELREKVLRWKECMELKGLKINIEKTKMMKSGKSGGEIVKTGRWQCAVCGKVLGQTPFNALIAVDGFTRGVVVPDVLLVTIQSFRCKICLTDEGVRCEGERMENLNLENGEVLEGVSKFRYLGDMLNGGGSRLASISRLRCGWKKLRELSSILTSKKVALRLKGESVWGMCSKFNDIWK